MFDFLRRFYKRLNINIDGWNNYQLLFGENYTGIIPTIAFFLMILYFISE